MECHRPCRILMRVLDSERLRVGFQDLLLISGSEHIRKEL